MRHISPRDCRVRRSNRRAITHLTQAILLTTLFDFGWVLLIVTVFLHHDARRHDLSYWWILPTYPFMPTVGLLAYLIHRNHRLVPAQHQNRAAPRTSMTESLLAVSDDRYRPNGADELEPRVEVR
jgi:hypothetical protein